MAKKNIAFFEQGEFDKIKEYRFTPDKFLKQYVKEFMIVEVSDLVKLETLPSSSVSLNYVLNGSIQMKQKNKGVVTLPKAFAFGVARTSLNFEFSKCTVLFVVILNPGMAFSLIKTPINQFFEKFIPFDEFFSQCQISFLHNVFSNYQNYEFLVRTIERFLLLEIVWDDTDGVVKNAIDKIVNTESHISVRQLLDEFKVSRDSFEKKFRRQVGTSPKQFSNIVRFRNLFENDHEEKTLTELGLSVGYYDQSHFIKDFRIITGKKPSSFFTIDNNI